MQSRITLPRLLPMMTAAFLAMAPTGLSAQGMQMPPPAVGVLELTAKSVPVINELPGRIAATRVAEVRPRVSGILLERVFEQGTPVQKDDVLYRIDPRLFKVRVASAEASLQRAVATQSNARQQLERQKNLRERNVSTGIDFDTAAVNLAQADADVALQQAALDEARINLEYTEVRAPISGIIGAALITEGALVTADGTQNLALIQQIDPSYADFTQSAQDMMALRRAVDEGKLASPAPDQASVRLVFDDGSVYADAGRLLFSSASVDSTTGQVTQRAEFPNARRDLLPGMYVRVRIEQAVRENAVVVPQRSIVRAADGKPLVYVVKADDTAEARPVELGQALETEWVVEKGLNAGDRVVVDGAQKVQPGGKIKPEPWQAEKAANAPAQAPKQ